MAKVEVNVVPGEKLLIKMWSSLVDKGIGKYLQPWHEKRIGEARNKIRHDEIVMLAEAQQKAEDVRAGRGTSGRNSSQKLIGSPGSAAEGRTEPTLDLADFSAIAADVEAADAVRKEVNVSKAVIVAEEILMQDDQEPPQESVDDDWLYAWRENAGRVSTDELQYLWGRILAGEVKNPGSYSFRTLEFLKGLSKDEAELISKVGQFVLKDAIFRDHDEILNGEGVTFAALLSLQDIGLLSGVEALGMTSIFTSNYSDRYGQLFVFGNRAMIIEADDVKKKLSLPAYSVSKMGRQVLSLANVPHNVAYMEAVAKSIIGQGFRVSMADWEWASVNRDRGRYTNAVEVGPET